MVGCRIGNTLRGLVFANENNAPITQTNTTHARSQLFLLRLQHSGERPKRERGRGEERKKEVIDMQKKMRST